MLNVACITTSRADFGIYLPLLERLQASPDYNLLVFAGGMHTAKRFGNSYKLIEEQGFELAGLFEAVPDGDSQEDIAVGMGMICKSVGKLWNRFPQIDLALVLGDRYEMFAATSALIPFRTKIAHFHGGETTTGAIDDKFRHAITMLSDIHFCSTKAYAARVEEMAGSNDHIYNVGAMGLDNILDFDAMSTEEFSKKFNFNISEPFILSTFHPETVSLGNKEKIGSLIEAFKMMQEPVLCTLPNADTEGTIIREALLNYEKDFPDRIKCVENLGQKGYLTAMQHCKMLVGNTSSGIIEAASFNKPVVNIGNRQEGRICGDNVVHTPAISDQIIKAYCKAEGLAGSEFNNPYGDGHASEKVMHYLSELRKQKYFSNE